MQVRRFTHKVVLYSIGLALLSIAGSALISYHFASKDIETTLRMELLAVVKSLAPNIDGELHELIYRDEFGEVSERDLFEEMQVMLQRAKKSLGLETPIYTLRPSYNFEDSGMLEFVLMTDPDKEGNWYVGNVYKAQPHNLRALEGEATTSGIYEDEEGVWISAVAPIFDSKMGVVSMLQADRKVDFFYGLVRERTARILFAAAITIALTILVAIYTARYITKPLVRLAQAVKELGTNDLDQEPLPVTSSDELGELTNAFNLMAKRVREQKQKLTISRDEAQAAAKAKSDFLANMSHEIRTPMNGVLGMTDLLLSTELNEDQRDLTETVKQSGTALLEIINNILDFSKIEAGKLELNNEVFCLYRLMEELDRQFSVACDQKRITLVHVLGEVNVPRYVRGDRFRLRQVLTNLIGNAIKFTPECGGILLRVEAVPQEKGTVKLAFSTIDSGIGIPEEKQQAIFKAFQQGDTSTTRQFGGTGLGLTIASQLVRLMQGELGVTSVEGVGSVFSFDVVMNQVNELPGIDNAQDPEALENEPREVGRYSILLVEDNAVNQKLALRLLKREEHRVTLAINGKEAIDKFQQDEFDIVLMDIQMPVMGGVEAMQAIRRTELGKRVPIVALTAHAMQGDAEKYISLGMNAHVAKPINPKELFKTLVRLVNESRSH